jgi:hypothetical protein
MTGSKPCPRRIVSSLLTAAAVCLGAGSALATCTPLLPASGIVCFMVVQPIDVCGTPGTGTSSCAPFNTTSTNGVGNPTTACNPSGSNPLNCGNPIGFVVNPTTGVANPTSGGVDVTRALLNQFGVDLTLQPIATYNSPINPNTNTTFQTLNVTQTTNSAGATVFDSADFRTLSYQNPPNAFSLGKPTPPPPPDPNAAFPFSPWGNPSTVINLFFVNTLVPPTQQSGGTLYGLGWIGNNGVAISQNTFGYPRSRTSAPPRPDTIAHELLHNLGLDHTTFAAGPWDPPSSSGVYLAPGGVAPPIPANPLVGECDPSYPACGANLMTTGSLRTEPTVGCVLASNPAPLTNPCVTTVSGITVPLPTLANGRADQITPLPSAFYPPTSTSQLPVPQKTQVLSGGSGLLFPNTTLDFLNPIPHETTQAQVETGGSIGSIVFDLSGPTSGGPGETLVAWILTLPKEQTFAKHNQFRVISQSRRDLIQDVSYYPDADNNSLLKEIGYYPDAGDNPEKLGARSTPCATPDAECLMVKFRPPGLEAQDSISFSKSILTDSTAITNDDLCKAKITYIFSDGYATTSNFGSCPATSLPLISSSWRPDPTAAPRLIHSNVLLAQASTSLPCTPDSTGNCPPLTLADANPSEEGGQPGNSCSNGAINGKIQSNVIVSTGQNCVFTNPCEIKGNLTIVDGGSAYLACTVDGNVTENGGSLKLDASAQVFGNVQIGSPQPSQAQASAFTIAPGAAIGGNLVIQNDPGKQQGTVCGVQIKGNLVAQGNLSPIKIGGIPAQNCAGNTIGGNLTCTNNTPAPMGGNNVVKGQAQGQCVTFTQ